MRHLEKKGNMSSYSKRISLKGALLFSLTENCMRNKCIGYTEILPESGFSQIRDHTNEVRKRVIVLDFLYSTESKYSLTLSTFYS